MISRTKSQRPQSKKDKVVITRQQKLDLVHELSTFVRMDLYTMADLPDVLVGLMRAVELFVDVERDQSGHVIISASPLNRKKKQRVVLSGADKKAVVMALMVKVIDESNLAGRAESIVLAVIPGMIDFLVKADRGGLELNPMVVQGVKRTMSLCGCSGK